MAPYTLPYAFIRRRPPNKNMFDENLELVYFCGKVREMFMNIKKTLALEASFGELYQVLRIILRRLASMRNPYKLINQMFFI